MQKYVGYIFAWDKLIHMQDIVDLKWVLVDGSAGLCIFESRQDIFDIKELIGLENIYELWLVDDWFVGTDRAPWYSTEQVKRDTFHNAAIQFPRERRADFIRSSIDVAWRVNELLVAA